MGEQRKSTKTLVIPYLMRHPGEVCHLDDIIKETGLTKDQVQSAVNNSRHDSAEFKRDIEIVIAGNAWRYNPPRNNGARMFEEVRTTKSGIVLIEDEEGNLYKAERIM